MSSSKTNATGETLARTIVMRLRWVMLGAMLFSMFNTLAGQPKIFWLDPENAMRGDGLRLHNHLNHTFEFFLSHGWLPYVLSCLIYFALAFIAVSILPRKMALVAAFSFLFGHYFGACNWLVVRWHLGFTGAILYGIVLGAAIALALSPLPGDLADTMIRRIRWIAVGTILLDFVFTLSGQPSSYWQNPQTVHEGNALFHWFLARGWWSYALMELVYCAVILLLASMLPRLAATAIMFGYILGHFGGSSNWMFYEWRMGMQAPVIYGAVLSAIIVFVSIGRGTDRAPAADALLEADAVGPRARCCA